MKRSQGYFFGLIARGYGRKMGLVRHYFHLARYRLGGFSKLKMINWNRVKRLVFVCKGNICRSPYAEVRARMMKLPCDSFGLEARAGVPADPSAIRGARTRGLELNTFQAKTARQFSIAAGDLLVAMEPWHVAALRSLPLPVDAQVTLLGLWCHPPRPHLEDPFGLSDEYFQTCFRIIDYALTSMSDLIGKPETSSHPR